MSLNPPRVVYVNNVPCQVYTAQAGHTCKHPDDQCPEPAAHELRPVQGGDVLLLCETHLNGSHMRATYTGECGHCGADTHWIEVNFEAWLCPGECTDAKWEEYRRACNE